MITKIQNSYYKLNLVLIRNSWQNSWQNRNHAKLDAGTLIAIDCLRSYSPNVRSKKSIRCLSVCRVHTVIAFVSTLMCLTELIALLTGMSIYSETWKLLGCLTTSTSSDECFSVNLSLFSALETVFWSNPKQSSV